MSGLKTWGTLTQWNTKQQKEGFLISHLKKIKSIYNLRYEVLILLQYEKLLSYSVFIYLITQ